MASLPHRPRTVLELDLTSAPLEVEPEDPIGRLRTRHRPRLRPLLRALHEAGDDPRVRGLVARVGRGALSWTVVQDVRDGVLAFRRSGKPAVVWAEALGEGGNGTADYVLASAFDRIWLQPATELGLLGVASETTFLRGALDRLGVEPQLQQRHEYKNAADRITRREFTAEHRESLEALTASVWTTAVEAIAAGRGLSVESVRALADRAPLSAEEALAEGLVDALGYRDGALADVRARAGGDVELLYADRWRRPRRVPRPVRPGGRRVVGLVEIRGAITSGRSRTGPGGGRAGSDTVGAALRAAREDAAVAAVVLRVDSPGGSAVASDVIHREVTLLRKSGTPVVVSMGALAASGGYFVSAPADVVVAQPATLTGSIGVFGGKAVVEDLLIRLGLTTGAVEQGAAARMYSARRPFTEQEQERLARMLDAVYADFVAKVAAGRHLDVDTVDRVARGRVWTGADAREVGLVDEFGGLRHAVGVARRRAGLRDDAPVRPAVHLSPLARLGRPRSSEDPRARAAAAGPGPLGGLVDAALTSLLARVEADGGPALLMPGVRLV